MLLGKNKLGFLLGTCRKEMYPSNLHNLWDRFNAIVLAWIMNTVSKDLLSSVIYASDSHKVWEDLRERFDKVNASRAFYLHKEIVTLVQYTFSVSAYFSRLRMLWDELEALAPHPSCACPESKDYATHFQMQKLWQFLMGLNESYAHVKSKVLMTSPLPIINQAYAMIINVESQRLNGTILGGFPFADISSGSTALMSNKMSLGGSSSGYGGYTNNYGCSSSGYGGSSNAGFNHKPRMQYEHRGGYGRIQLGCDYCHLK